MIEFIVMMLNVPILACVHVAKFVRVTMVCVIGITERIWHHMGHVAAGTNLNVGGQKSAHGAAAWPAAWPHILPGVNP